MSLLIKLNFNIYIKCHQTKYWKSVEELENGSIVEALRNNEFVEAIPTEEFF
jgi:MoCo/4Fe-4S cofactor protein with predicted Tat translocation signal